MQKLRQFYCCQNLHHMKPLILIKKKACDQTLGELYRVWKDFWLTYEKTMVGRYWVWKDSLSTYEKTLGPPLLCAFKVRKHPLFIKSTSQLGRLILDPADLRWKDFCFFNWVYTTHSSMNFLFLIELSLC